MLKTVMFILILSTQLTLADVVINEVMYNPMCSFDKHCEWVELYNNNETSINMTGWTIKDNNKNDSLEGYNNIILQGHGYVIIVDDDTRVYNDFEIDDNVLWLYTGDDSIGDGLSNNESITLYDNNMNLIDVLYYDNNVTLEGNSFALINGEFVESEPTPGKSNENNQTNSNDYSKIKINEFMANPLGDDDSSIPNGEWVELYNTGNEDLDLLGFKLKDDSEKELLIDNVHIEESTTIKSKNYLVVYVNGVSGFLNNNGFEKIILYDLNNNLIDEISYSDSKEGLSWSKINSMWQMTEPTPNEENKDNSTIEQVTDSKIEIDRIYDLGSNKKAEWGSSIRVKISVYKGDTEKEVIESYISGDERITKISKANVYEKFSNNEITFPIQLGLNCNEKYKDGTYNIIVEGLNTEDKKNIEISGISKECYAKGIIKDDISKKESIKKEDTKENNITQETTKKVANINNKIVYENSSKEASRLGVFLFIALLIILISVLINERKDIS